MSCCYKSDLRCASLSASESGIFELLGQLYPARLLFFAVKKKSVAEGIKGNPRGVRTKSLRQATHDTERLFPISHFSFLISHSSLMGGRIRRNKNQIGITLILG